MAAFAVAVGAVGVVAAFAVAVGAVVAVLATTAAAAAGLVVAVAAGGCAATGNDEKLATMDSRLPTIIQKPICCANDTGAFRRSAVRDDGCARRVVLPRHPNMRLRSRC